MLAVPTCKCCLQLPQNNTTTQQLKVFVSLSHRQLAADAGHNAAPAAAQGVPLEHGGAQRTQQRDAHRSAQRHGSAGMLHKKRD